VGPFGGPTARLGLDVRRRHGDEVAISKRLSFWLRHRPGAAGLILDAQGWTDVDAVVAALRRTGMDASLARLHLVIANDDKKRFELNAGETRMRAQQGHSVPVALRWPVRAPPERLYHGTTARFLDAIIADGLKPMGRHQVHLSPDVATARRVGSRRGMPVILAVLAGELHAGGASFQLTANGVWLTDAVPPQFIDVAEGAAEHFTAAD
jgi:putative RNA 2'-phosphotransferase